MWALLSSRLMVSILAIVVSGGTFCMASFVPRHYDDEARLSGDDLF